MSSFEIQNEKLGYSADGKAVFLNEKSTHAKTHIAHHPRLLEAVKAALPDITLDCELIRLELKATEIIGTTDLVATTNEDEIVYALRVGRSIYSRFVKNKKPTPSKQFVIDVRQNRVSKNDYFLYTTYVGGLTPSFPGGNFTPEKSRVFWSNHALVYGTQELVPGTETTKCPW
jgi:hypothetical protein